MCLPDVFERTVRYTIECKDFWESHLEKYRDFWNEIINSKKCYGSAFFSCPYMDLVDKSVSGKYFQRIKEFYEDKDILIVEGSYSQSGVGNDLFQGVKSIERIICPFRNAYSKYEMILDTVRQHGINKLILLMLGSTAKVLGILILNMSGIRWESNKKLNSNINIRLNSILMNILNYRMMIYIRVK